MAWKLRVAVFPAGQNEDSTASNHEAGLPELVDLSEFINVLQTGLNVFAIEAHNGTLTSSDLSMIPALQILPGGGVAAACENDLDNDRDGLTDLPYKWRSDHGRAKFGSGRGHHGIGWQPERPGKHRGAHGNR